MKASAHQRFSLAKGQHLTVKHRTADAFYPVHWHSFFEVEIVLAGEGICRINDVAYPIPEYSLFFLSPTDFHALEAHGEMHLINLSFDEEMLSEQDIGAILSSRLERAYTLSAEEHERFVAAARLLAHECEIDGDCRRALLSYLIHTILRKNTDVSHHDRHDPLTVIRRAYLYLEMHFKEPITLTRLAAEAGYHPSYFSEQFRRVTGEGYTDTLARLRVGYARSLLANGFSVTDACFASGFGSLSAFGTAFRRLVSVSPSEYKKQHTE